MKKTVLVTGASSGLGYEFAKKFAKEGYNLIVVARNHNKLMQLKDILERKYQIQVVIITKDLAEKNAALDIYHEVSKKKIHVDILVNNAGFGDFIKYADSDWEKQYEMVQVNIVATIQLTRYFVKPMIRKGRGRILNVSSTAAFQPGPYYATYYASKAFLLSFTEAIAIELKGTGVKVMALCPGPMKTGFKDRADAENSKLFKILKLATPKEVAVYGYHSLMRNKVVSIHGLQNKLMVIGTKLAPRFVIRPIVKYIQKEI